MWKDRDVIKWKTYWYLTVIEQWDIVNNKQRIKVRCVCGKEKMVQVNNLISWSTKSCWCKKWEIISERKTIHWMWWLNWIYNIFRQMNSRCKNSNNKDYWRYWWRWIKVERNSFEEFYEDMWKSYNEHVEKFWKKNTTIDRIDNDWNYCKENCRRATLQQQWNNRRNNSKVVYWWKEYNICELSNMFWVDHSWLSRYIKSHPDDREKHYEIKNGK